jgi:protein farnesyltransferase/geranylgeranyltransferase type-1 subunit alpha
MAVSREVIERIDHKNYHAWSFRTWLVELQGWWEQELEFAEEMIEEDCFNNSAWTYRFFLVAKETEGKDGEVREAVAKREV